MRRILSALLCLTLVLSPVLAFPAQTSFFEDYDAIESASSSVIYLEADDDFDDEIITTGSGFVAFDNKTFITNYHVIEDAVWIRAYDENYNEYEVGKLIAIDKDLDIAIISFKASTDIKPLVLADSPNLKRGQRVAAIGYPQGVSNTFSTGIISALVQEDGVNEIQFTAPISQGSSGGALFNAAGEVIGITSSTLIDSQNINYAVDISHVIALYAQHAGELID
ncbi:MAG: serine protease, partial [Clostridiales bacterium]|nr:serine protease [Clostridiales bacterium]